MNPSEKQSWELVQAKGRASFVLREGILRRGVLPGAIFGLCWCFSDLLRHRLDTSEAFAIAAMSVATALAVGMCNGVLLWQKRQREHDSN
jgi:hypothetical protein